jgi:hypothetical protein
MRLPDTVAGLVWRPALVAAASVLPVSALCAWATDEACNHLEGDVRVAERGTPRGSWCDAVDRSGHWIVLVAGPCLLALVLVLICGRRRWLYLLAWSLAVGVAVAQAVVVDDLRAYPLF